MSVQPIPRSTPLKDWIARGAGGALLLLLVASSVFRIDGIYVFAGVLLIVIGGTIAHRLMIRTERKRLGLPIANAMSDRVKGLAMQMRARAAALNDRFGHQAEPMSDLQRDDLAELDRIARLRGYQNVRDAIVMLGDSEAMALRQGAEELDRFAASIRGKGTIYRLTRSQWIASTIGVAMLAGAGIFFVVDAEARDSLFYTGVVLLAGAALAALVIFLMQTETD